MPAHADRSSASLLTLISSSRWRRVAWACAVFFPACGHCQIYANADWSSGTVVLSNFKTEHAAVVLVVDQDTSASGLAAGRASTRRDVDAPSAELRQLVDSVANRTAVSARLIHAVIRAESSYDPKAVSVKGAIGLMQLLPETARRFGAADPYSAEQNVVAGASYLKWLMAMFGNDLELVLAAYNAGEQAVLKAGRQIPPYPETQAYVKRIMADLHRSPKLAL